jgi:predicted DNA-binding protein YlxM (UPF0122 family)
MEGSLSGMDTNAKYILEYDFYGALLTKRQQQVINLYHEENLTLAEIAEEFGISRQGVHDTLKKAEALLDGYEEKLRLIARFDDTRKGIACADSLIDELVRENSSNRELTAKLNRIKKITDGLNN